MFHTFEEPCKDHLPDCGSLHQSNCIGEFKDWAMEFCPHSCGYCSEGNANDILNLHI